MLDRRNRHQSIGRRWKNLCTADNLLNNSLGIPMISRWHRECSTIRMPTPIAKPYDICQRTFGFARDTVRAYPSSVRTHTPSAVAWLQLVRSATSVGANLEEAQAGSSKADFRFRVKVALREAREALYWLRIIQAAGLTGAELTEGLRQEANELVAILTTIAKNSGNGGNTRR